MSHTCFRGNLHSKVAWMPIHSYTSDMVPVLSKGFLDIQATTECRFKCVCDMIRTNNHFNFILFPVLPNIYNSGDCNFLLYWLYILIYKKFMELCLKSFILEKKKKTPSPIYHSKCLLWLIISLKYLDIMIPHPESLSFRILSAPALSGCWILQSILNIKH